MAVPLKSTSSMFSSSSPTSSSMKLKSLIQTLIISQVYRLIREISNASSILVRVLRKKQYNLLSVSSLLYPKRSSKKQKNHIFFGSFRLHYNFCSSHVVPVSAPVRLPEELYMAHLKHEYSTWESMDACYDANQEFQEPSQLSSYPRNLEDTFLDEELQEPSDQKFSSYLRKLEDKVRDGEDEGNEIDKLADMFIANSHEKFMLEKVDSYRRSQDMLKRSTS